MHAILQILSLLILATACTTTPSTRLVPQNQLSQQQPAPSASPASGSKFLYNVPWGKQ